jgi:hypothetical protein
MTIKMTMTIWDNSMTDFDRQDILLYCEHAIRKVCQNNYGKVKVINRSWMSVDFEVSASLTPMNWILDEYNARLNRLGAWHKENEDGMEILVWENEWL